MPLLQSLVFFLTKLAHLKLTQISSKAWAVGYWSLRGVPERDIRFPAGVFIFLRPSILVRLRWFPCFRDDKRSVQVNDSINRCCRFSLIVVLPSATVDLNGLVITRGCLFNNVYVKAALNRNIH